MGIKAKRRTKSQQEGPQSAGGAGGKGYTRNSSVTAKKYLIQSTVGKGKASKPANVPAWTAKPPIGLRKKARTQSDRRKNMGTFPEGGEVGDSGSR